MPLFIALAALALIAFAVGYRKTGAALVAAALAAGGALYYLNWREEDLAATRVPISELVLENVTLQPYVGSYRIAGRMSNKSAQYTVRQVDIVVTVRDCTGEGAAKQCVTVGESNEILNLAIPPGEARDFAEAVRFHGSSPKLKGRLDWSYAISRIRAE
jgi:hypothetical protein